MHALRAIALVSLLGGCTKPDATEIVQPLESTLGAAVPTAYFAAVAMSALGGDSSPCANVVAPGAAARVEIDLGAGCPPMFGADDAGTVVVTGAWTPQLATFVMDFTGVTSGGQPMLVVGIGALTVTPGNTDHLTIAYGEEDIMVGTGDVVGAGLDEVAWVVDVDTAGTADPTDDTIAVSGGDQSLLAVGSETPDADLTQVAVAAATFKAGCRKNPSSGIAAVQRAGTRGGGWVLFDFHDACDGTADVAAALAPYEPLITDSLPLAFLQ